MLQHNSYLKLSHNCETVTLFLSNYGTYRETWSDFWWSSGAGLEEALTELPQEQRAHGTLCAGLECLLPPFQPRTST